MSNQQQSDHTSTNQQPTDQSQSKSNTVFNWVISISAIFVFLAGFGYFVLVAIAIIGDVDQLKSFKQAVEGNVKLNLGLPIAIMVSFTIVSIFWSLFRPDKSKEAGALSLKLFNLEFSGPSGPITLWVICYLSIVYSMKLLSP